MGAQEKANELLNRLDQCTETEEILSILGELHNARLESDSTSGAEKEWSRLEIYTFERLIESTGDDPNTAKDIILKELLPMCLQEDSASSYTAHELREKLAKWVEQFPDEAGIDLRDDIIAEISPLLTTPNMHPACWTLATIGYRTPEIENQLWGIVQQHDDDEGDEALSTLISLGWENRPQVLEELKSRISDRFNPSLRYAASLVTDTNVLEAVYERLLLQSEEDEVARSITLGVIRDILKANCDDSEVHDKVWSRIAALVEREPARWYWVCEMSGFPAQCNSSLVIPAMLRWMASIPISQDHPDAFRHHINTRAAECIMPNQLVGWSTEVDGRVLDLIRLDVCQDTNEDGYYSTLADINKRAAWVTLLNTGNALALQLFDPSVVKETSRFEQQRVMEWLACFRIDPLPKEVVGWIKAEIDQQGSIDGREFARTFAAVRLARSSATFTALETLLDFGYTNKKQVIVQSSDAVAETAVYLAMFDASAVLALIIDKLRRGSRDHHRLAAAVALKTLANRPNSLVSSHVDKILSMIFDEQRDVIERGTLIETLGYLRNWNMSSELESQLEKLSLQQDDWEGGGSLFVLANQGKLEENPRFMSQVLPLRQDGRVWYLDTTRKVSQWSPYIIGLLYSRNSESLQSVVSTIITNSDWGSVIQVLRWLELAHGTPDSPRLPASISKAIVERIRNKQSTFYSETDLVRALALLAPDTFAGEKWEDMWNDWLPESRKALADAYHLIPIGSGYDMKVIGPLVHLCKDSVYAVRRSAYRSLSHQSIEVLYAQSQSWLSSTSGPAKLAAEACGWLEVDNAKVDQDKLDDIYQKLLQHRQKSVRQSTKISLEERRKRKWAEDYFRKICDVNGETNDDVLKAWRYGEALAQVGDDSFIEVLKDYLKQNALPPNVRFWMSQIIEKLQENWREITRKWPEPWLDLSGAIEQGEGKLLTQDKSVRTISYSICKEPATIPHEHTRWYGIITASELLLHTDTPVVLELADGRQGNVIFHHTLNNVADFTGTGPYPELHP